MRILRKFLRRSELERGLVLRALAVVPLVRVALWVLPFRIVHRVVGNVGRGFSPPLSGERVVHENGPSARGGGLKPRPTFSVEQIAWAVTAVAARVPRATCLTQALAASLLLSRYGHHATLRVGVAKDDHGRLRAHAWLESNGVTVLGEPAPGAFHAFPPLVLS